MHVIVGLGNPGRKYENTRHNMGFRAVDAISEKLGIAVNRLKFKSLIGLGTFEGEPLLLVKPSTYMNASGEAVREVMNFYKLPPENLLVIFDDIDIPLGDIRMRPFGSAGTHNGMRSVIYQLSTDRFPRIRIGIGTAETDDLISHVIGDVAKEEEPLLQEACERARDAACCYLEHGINIAMNRYNLPKQSEKNN